MQGGAIYFDCVFGARLLEISGSTFVANGDGGVVDGAEEMDEGGGGVDTSSGPQPVICVGAECNNGNFTCAEFLSYVVDVQKGTIQGMCLGDILHVMATYHGYAFFNLPEGVTIDLADGFQIADLCPAECSGVVSKVRPPMLYTYKHAVCGN
jgi:hypothetical protein